MTAISVPRTERPELRTIAIVDLIPNDHSVQSFVGFAMLTRFLRVHLDTEAATVDLRSPKLHQVMNRAIKPIRVHCSVHASD